ncbi:hypothetical protein BDZ97DRAFT_1923603 [Flammula alnicola]|nr:hypothetical protein BDZ97DRAFT_1923603 [Flammula alnicola]
MQPTEIQRQPSESLDPVGRDKFSDHDARFHQATTKQQQQIQQRQQQLQHREALRLALGSILTPKRPPLSTSSRSSSGTASPAYPFSLSASGTHTPAGPPPIVGTAPSYYPLAHGPNSSEHLHPHYPYLAHPHPYPLPPSRLGPSRSTSSTTPSPSGTAPSSAHPSPRPEVTCTSPLPLDIEPLPPAVHQDTENAPKQLRPPITPLQPSKDGDLEQQKLADAGMGGGSYEQRENNGQHASGTTTPRAKFLQTLQSKSAWDALIHGSFS